MNRKIGRIILTKTDGGRVSIEKDMIVWFEEDTQYKNQVIIQTVTSDSFPVVESFEEVTLKMEAQPSLKDSSRKKIDGGWELCYEYKYTHGDKSNSIEDISMECDDLGKSVKKEE